MQKQPASHLYTVTEAARILRMGRSTLYKLAKAGHIAHTVNPVGRIGFTEDDIAAALEAGHRPAVA